MSLAGIRKALETQLATITPAIQTAWENVAFTPVPGTPYQSVNLLLAQPANPEMGPMYIDQGFMQVSLFYPKDNGPADAQARAELIRAAFPIGASYVASGTVVNIIATPEVAPARIDDDRYLVPVRVRFSAIQGG